MLSQRAALALCLALTAGTGVRPSQGLEQTSEVFGAMVAQSEGDNVQDLLKTCFAGINMTTCTYDEEASLSDADLSGVFADFAWSSVFTGNDAYCMTCCNNRRMDFAEQELIALQCDLSNPRATKTGEAVDYILLNETAWEFRFATRKTVDDSSITRCSLARTDYTKLIKGYELKIFVQEYDNVVAFWRGVSKCEATAIEVSQEEWTDSVFTEKITFEVNGAGRVARPGSFFWGWAILAAAWQSTPTRHCRR